jgi:hypothetical protein
MVIIEVSATTVVVTSGFPRASAEPEYNGTAQQEQFITKKTKIPANRKQFNNGT